MEVISLQVVLRFPVFMRIDGIPRRLGPTSSCEPALIVSLWIRRSGTSSRERHDCS